MKIILENPIRDYKQFLFFCTILIAFSLFMMTNPFYLGIAVFVGIYTIVMSGMTLLVGFAGQPSLGHNAFFGIGAYTTAIVSTKFGASPWLGLLAGLILNGVIAFIIGLPTLRLRGHYLAVATLGFGGITEAVFMHWTGMTGGADGIAGISGIPLGPLMIKGDILFYYLVWTIALLFLIFSFNIINTRTGRVFKAIHGSEVATNSLGINVNRYKLYIFIYSALVAGIGGWLLAHYITFISPGSFGIHFSVLILCMVVIGGQTSIWGPVFGAIVYTVFPIILWASEDYDTVIYGIILMAVIMFMPKGIASFVFDTIRMSNLGHKGIKK